MTFLKCNYSINMNFTKIYLALYSSFVSSSHIHLNIKSTIYIPLIFLNYQFYDIKHFKYLLLGTSNDISPIHITTTLQANILHPSLQGQGGDESVIEKTAGTHLILL